MLKLGVNVDHIATIRQARLADSPSPLEGAKICEESGAWGITAHLREDRRHMQDKDMRELVENVARLNMEMAVTEDMVRIASELKPYSCCLVPEKREELTTEGGLNLLNNIDHIKSSIDELHQAGIIISIFIDPNFEQIEVAKQVGAEYIELHTGSYANATGDNIKKELDKLISAANFANSIGLHVNAGHGIDYRNINGILEIPHLCELNIGHSIVSRAVMVGMKQAVTEMINLMKDYQ